MIFKFLLIHVFHPINAFNTMFANIDIISFHSNNSSTFLKGEKHFHNNKKKRRIKFYNSLDTQFLYDMIIPYPRISTLTQTAR